jgi:iron(III) transport system ATP-binding protein
MTKLDRVAPDVSPPPASEAPYLRISGLSKNYGAFTAVENVSFGVAAGEFVCLLGPSGCGKTTLLRTIAGLEKQSAGQIHQGGHDISSVATTERNFGIVFQSYALFPNLTVAENVAYGLVARRVEKRAIKARVEELLTLVGLSTEISKYPAQLSGGQQQRVAVARALATSPGLLLLDEPLSALDAQVRMYLRQEIRALQRRLAITTIMVTHDQEEALAIADRVIVMNRGRIEQIGSVTRIYDEPESEFVARFVGTSTFLLGEVLDDFHVRAAGVDVEVGAPIMASPGDAVKLCFRPEDASLHRAGEPGNVNLLPGVVESVEFKGASWRVSITSVVEPGLTMFADISAQAHRTSRIAEGAHVNIHVPPSRIRVFPAFKASI